MLETKHVCLATMGKLIGQTMVASGARVKIIREEKSAFFKCEVQPVSLENGPVFMYLWASELKPVKILEDNNQN